MNRTQTHLEKRSKKEKAGESLFEEDNEPRSEANTVNLLASIPFQDPFWKGNLREYKRLLKGIGLKVHVLFGPESGGVGEWREIPRASFNVLVSPWYGKNSRWLHPRQHVITLCEKPI